MANEISVQTCISVGESIKSFSALLKKASAGELDQKPKFPNYRKPGFQLIAFPKRALKLKEGVRGKLPPAHFRVDGQIRLPLGLQVKAWFGLKEFFLPMPSNLDFEALREVRILPRNGCFYVEYVYPVVAVPVELDRSKVLGLDHGLNNCMGRIG